MGAEWASPLVPDRHHCVVNSVVPVSVRVRLPYDWEVEDREAASPDGVVSLTSVVPVVPSARPAGAAEVAPRRRDVVVLELWQAEIVANVLRAMDVGEELPPSACREARAMVEHPSSRRLA